MRHRFADRARQDVSQLTSRRDAELDEDLAEVPLDRPRAEEQPGPDSGLESPSLTRSAICCSCGVSWSLAAASAVRFRTVSPVASSSRRARSAKASMPIEANISWAARNWALASTR